MTSFGKFCELGEVTVGEEIVGPGFVGLLMGVGAGLGVGLVTGGSNGLGALDGRRVGGGLADGGRFVVGVDALLGLWWVHQHYFGLESHLRPLRFSTQPTRQLQLLPISL